ncbi:glycoside hydrolase family 9 protein [Sphingomonas sp. A2-49]|uniref:glycoside hydrolase family 9 protein n=1 Tax=Sphingomonas sp. A2-49 TaxID=1391375 RepID=UPI0021CFEF80|nr:glycoside hydrolase family 9 protein [Sphingomonas sp. A2-49]MCU6453697.1 glycoside hydrolase family 9 protein [Sphingomonas sp. A2-49]
MTARALLAAVAAVALAGTAPVPEPAASTIRVSQIGYETGGAKVAVVAGLSGPQPWRLLDAAGRAVAHGETRPFGTDASSGEDVQRIDFGAVVAPGAGYRLAIGDVRSQPFAIAERPFLAPATAAMGFFYQQRSGVPIDARYVPRPDLARAAGQPRERVTCFAGTDQRGVRWPGCDYRLDTTGGWYDAGDHGKYVVNGGIAAWTLLDLHERLAAWGDSGAFADGRLALPERGNGGDDLLDEAKVEVAFLLSMQVPAGQRLTVAFSTDTGKPAGDFRTIDAGGLVHTKVADERWTGLPMAPADDPMRRFLYPPSTAATCNMIAVAAQAARIWRERDPAFAARALDAARRGWAAAQRVPNLYASSDFTGSGGYGDRHIDDERFWAATQLFVTTGDPALATAIEQSPFLRDDSVDFGWGGTALPGLMTLATVPNALPPATVAAIRARIVTLADRLLAERARSGYRLPMAGANFGWGSNSTLLNRAMVLGVAWQITRNPAYRDAVADVADFVFGRNALDRSFVTGFGARTVHQPHHRFWAHAADARYPEPPPGVLSGGPNAGAREDDTGGLKGRCVGQTCWRDDWRAFTMNEVAINWNAPLVWVTAFIDATRVRRAPAPA